MGAAGAKAKVQIFQDTLVERAANLKGQYPDIFCNKTIAGINVDFLQGLKGHAGGPYAGHKLDADAKRMAKLIRSATEGFYKGMTKKEYFQDIGRPTDSGDEN